MKTEPKNIKKKKKEKNSIRYSRKINQEKNTYSTRKHYKY